jgi:hypothetical protein
MKPQPIKMIRQGDVGIFPIATLPMNAKRQDLPRPDLVLAYGEVTGHAHRILAPHKVSMWHAGEQRYIVVEGDAAGKGATLTHEEHGPQVLEPGVYQVKIQREYTLGGEIRNVAD